MGSVLQRETRAVASVDREVLRYAPAIAAAVAALGIVLVFWDTAASIVAIWNRSPTFAHGYVVVPIAIWLAWRQRRELLATPARPWLPALVAGAAAGCLWLMMSIAEVNSGRQFALAFMVQAAIIAVVGLGVARVAAMPLLFLLFAVPTGEFLLPTLMDWTADFTVAALRASGVPVFREANQFVIPSGSWSVVEACSGLRYLIASVMIGVVYAMVSYRARWRRIAFIGASVVVPILANWLRAYMIVMIGHLSNNQLAVGVDHLIYGWLFFGVVMLLLFWVGSFWSESDATVPASQSRDTSRPAATAQLHFFVVALVAIVTAGSWRPVLALLDGDDSRVVPKLVALGPSAGFVPTDNALPSWTPAFGGHSATLRQTFSKGGAESALYIAYYRNQTKGRELVTSVNQLVTSSDRSWTEVLREPVTVSSDGKPIEVMRSVLGGPRERLVAYRLYWIDGKLTISDHRTKAWLVWSKLHGRGDDAALIVFYAPEREGRDAAREALEALLPNVLRMLAATSEAR
jgi:exosortase A